MEKQRETIQLKLSAQAEKYASREAPLEVRRMAARGALPLPPVELATVLFALMHDPDAEVKGRARDSLDALPEGVLDAVLTGQAHPALLDHLAHAHAEKEERLEKIALNAATSDSTIAFLAGRPFRRVVDIVSNNQERMLRYPPIVDALGDNPLTGRAVIDRILSFLGIEERAEEAKPIDPDAIGDEEARAALAAVLGEDFSGIPRQLLDENVEADPEEVKAGGNLYALVQNMSVFQKIKLSRMGNKEARSLLVRDRNKVVAVAAVTSPKITENELLSIAQSRAVCDEVIRQVANSRDATRHYMVKLALAQNPRTPQATAMQFANYLQDKDLRNLMKSKDVPSAISTHARRILMKKGKI
jgi:hypothetical protein